MAENIELMAAALYGAEPKASEGNILLSGPAATQAPPAGDTQPKTDAERAAAMYGNPGESITQQPQPQAETPSKARTEAEAAQSMYGKEEAPPLLEVPPEVAELRNAEDRRMYPAQTTFAQVLSDSEVAADMPNAKEIRQGIREMREMAADLSLAPKDVTLIKERAAYVRTSNPDVSSQREAAVEALNQEFGEEAAQAWRDARTLLQRDPRTAKVIEALNLGDDPQVVLMIAKAARAQRNAGKLKSSSRKK